MAVADVLISKVLDSLFSFITDEIEQQVKLVVGVDDEVKMLAANLQSIQTVLIDAEKRQLKEDTVKLWLARLKLKSYEIDDVLDEWSTEILRSKIEGEEYKYPQKPKRSKVWSFVLSLCFCYREVGFRHDIGIKIRELNTSLDVIAKEKERYNFQLIQGINEPAHRPMTTSVVHIPEIKGREHDKNDVMHLLFVESKLNPHVISVVGMAGIGKTTLAQLVYNEDRVKSLFDIRIWVCVSDPFDEMRIAKAILESLKGNTPNVVEMQTIVAEIQKYIEGKRFLLVLDDVWNEDARKWKQVEQFLKSGSLGSKILVTTRKEKVARTTGCSPKDIIQLGLLSNEECWMVFSQVAFPEGNNHNYNEHFEEIGRKIVKKCRGLPLSVNTIGGLLRFKDSIAEWQRVLESEFWELEEVEEQVFAPLRLSFDDLSPSLKQCLLYCAVFPKDFEMSRRKVIAMWGSQGYIKGAKNKDVEMMGNELFQNLCMRSFFQDFQFDIWNESVDVFKMHDVVHDFAESLIMRKESCSIEVNNLEELMRDPNENKIFHAGIVLRKGVTFPSSLSTLEKLRSLVMLSNYSMFKGSLADIFNQLTCLRSLSLCRCGIEEVPPNISKLVHLRQLDLFGNEGLKELPKTICKLYNLETLDVKYCRLESLPRDIGKLVNLKCLCNESCNILLPKEVGKLNGLQRLSNIVIREDEGEALCLGDLQNLNQLGGSLEILFPKWRRPVRDAEKGVLKEKKNLSQLDILFSGLDGGREGEYEEELIEALGAPPNLKYLNIYDYRGIKIPSWIFSLTCLTKVVFSFWTSCEELPALGNLPSLEYLEITGFNCIKRVGDEFVGMKKNKIGASSSTTTAFPKLTELVFGYMKNWEEWNEEEEDENKKKERNSGEEEGIITSQIMPCLRSLKLEYCPKLKELPSYILNKTSLIPEIGGCDVLEQLLPKVRTYSEWVIDGEYDWPPKCCSCQAVLEEGNASQTTRLGCLHIIHTNCLISHIKSFPLHTAPAGYVCSSCSTSIWPPKIVKDSGSRLHSNLKEAIMQTGLEKNLFGNHPVSMAAPPPAFTSDPLVSISSSPSMTKDEISIVETGTELPKISVSDIMEIESPSSAGNYLKSSSPAGPGATTRKVGIHVERQNSEVSYYADDEDGNRKKYSRRGPIRHKFLRALLPFWSNALPTLPVTAPSRKDGSNADDVSEGRTRHQRPSRMDPRKILLVIAIMACMATMGILYYRIAQRGLGEGQAEDELQ